MAPLVALSQARGTLFPWVPVFIGIGIALWFAQGQEPGRAVYLAAAGLVLLGAGARAFGPEVLHPLAVMAACLAAGVLAAGLRSASVAAPVLDFRYYGPVQGRIVGIDRSQADVIRLTLDRVVLERTAPDRTPARVRVSLHGSAVQVPLPGQVVMLTGHLAAPEGPVEPRSFDFRRMAWFDRLGAVGYTRTPVLLWEDAAPRALGIDRLRSHLSGAMLRAMPSEAGAFATGAMTGDRSGISQDTVVALRDSSLAHLLAISGMNLAFLIAFVFAVFRTGVALIPPLALRVDAKKVAAVLSFCVAFFYLLLSGSNVATERAFIMVSVMLGAVLLDRRALTLRSVALAGIILLLTKPESLLEPGFQMSFAATTALIAGFGAMRDRLSGEHAARWSVPVFTLILSSVIGGIATAPFAGAHFNRFADYGLLANLLTVPVMGAVVMPAGAVAAMLAPFGLAALPLWAMELGAAWILFVAHWVAGLKGAVTGIPAPGAAVLPLITLGMLWIILWHGRIRWAGAGPVALALAVWVAEPRPVLLISADGALAGVMGPKGRVLSTASGAGFAARNWLENDGDLISQETAAARPGFDGPRQARRFTVAGVTGVVLKGKGAADAVPAACADADFVVVAEAVARPPPGCRLFDLETLRQTGAVAFWPIPGGLQPEAAQTETRHWSRARNPVALSAVLAPLGPKGQ